MAAGKTIQIYCPSGEPRGIRIAEITTRIVQAVVVPRAKLEEGLNRPELSGVGLYVLFGMSETGGRPLAYIGEAEDCAVRLKQHNSKSTGKDFWITAVAIVSRTGMLTKAHCKCLEYLGIHRAKEADRYELDNGNAGGEPALPEWMRADVEEVFETADVLLSSLGFPLFEAVAERSRTATRHLFRCTRGGAKASAFYSEEGMVVLEGSIARPEVLPSASAAHIAQRAEFINSGAVEVVTQGLRFVRDTAFSSPSAASVLICGGNSNGWTDWKDDEGRTLDEVYRSE